MPSTSNLVSRATIALVVSGTMGIPDNLKRLREDRGWSQTDLAREARVSQQLVSQLERGVNLTSKKLPQIARALGKTIEEIDPSFGDVLGGDELRARLLQAYDGLPADRQQIALAQMEALRLLQPPKPSKADPQKGQRRKR